MRAGIKVSRKSSPARRFADPPRTLKSLPAFPCGPMVEGESTVRIELPTGLREYAGGRDSFEVRAATLADAIRALNAQHPGLAYRLLDDQGRMRRYVLVFVNEDPVAHLEPEAVRLRDGDTVHIVPSVAGG